jgi:hypothetical protein
MDMMLLERRGISGAIDDGTDDVIEMVSSDIIAVLRVVCDVKYAGIEDVQLSLNFKKII